MNLTWWMQCGLAVVCAAGITAGAQAQATDASVCEVVNHPKQFDGKTVRVKGLVEVDFDSFVIHGDSCTAGLWLSYPAGTKAKSGPAAVLTMQLAANATGTTGTARPAVTLQKNKDFETFDDLLSQKPKTPGMCLGCVKNDVMATLVGRVDGTEDPGLARDKDGKITRLDGFGNMNQYMARLVIEQVSDVSAKEIDYTKAPKVDSDTQGGTSKDYMALTKKAEEGYPKDSPAVVLVEEAINAFGAPGQDNGVIVAFGDSANVPDGEGTKSAKNSPDGLLLTARFDSDKLKGDAMSRAIAHEGTEIVLLRDKQVLSCLEMEAKAWSTVLSVTIGSRQKTLTLPGGVVFWNAAWPAADRNANVSSALTSYAGDRVEYPR